MAVLGSYLGLGAPRAESGGIPLGPFEFYPSVRLEAGDDSNIFNQHPDFAVSDQLVYLRAPLVWRLPFHQSAWDVTFIPGWNGYKEHDELDGSTQEIGTRLFLAFASGAKLEIIGSQLDDYLNTTAFDPGGEVAFGDSPYCLDTASVAYEHLLSPRQGFRFRTDYQALHFDEDSDTSFVNYRDVSATLSYLNALSESTTFFAEFEGDRQDQERTQIELDEDRSIRRAVHVGMEHRFDRSDSARFYVGYEQLRIVNTDDAEFSGLIAEAAYGRQLPGGLRLTGNLIRATTASVFNVNNYYINNRLLVDLDWRPQARIFYRLIVDLTRNAYPEAAEQFCRSAQGSDVFVPVDAGPCPLIDHDDPPDGIGESADLAFPPEIIGVVRLDRQFRVRGAVGFQFSRTAAVELGYDHTDRNSNMDPYDYETGRFSLEFRFGWRPDRELI